MEKNVSSYSNPKKFLKLSTELQNKINKTYESETTVEDTIEHSELS